MTNLPPAAPTPTPTRIMPVAETDVFSAPMNRPPADPSAGPSVGPAAGTGEPAQAVPPTVPPAAAAAPGRRPSAAPQRTALVVLAAMGVLVLAFIVMIIVGVSSESINALAVIATPIASMVAAYYGITLSIQQVKNERAEKEKAIARADAAEATSRETEVWAAQMESGLRVAMAKLNAAHVNTDEVTKAAGTPDDFF